MASDDKTLFELNCAPATAVEGLKVGKGPSEPTLSDAATLVFQGSVGVESSSLARQRLVVHRAPSKKFGLFADKSKKAIAGWLAGCRRYVQTGGLATAIVVGALGGLVVSFGIVMLVRGAGRHDARVSEGQQAREVLVSVTSESGAAVRDARVRVGTLQGATDEHGEYRATYERRSGKAEPDEVEVRVECPDGYVARDTQRTLKWTGLGSRAPQSRELTFQCEVDFVELSLDLRVLRGEARFRLGEQDLGPTRGGRLHRQVMVPALTEQVLTANPILGPKERPPERIQGGTRPIVVGESPASFQHTVEFVWPRVGKKGSSQIPYRL
jgi:hypothetical protein